MAVAASASSSSPIGSSVQEWQAAAGRLAAVTPLLVVGTDSYYEADMLERLKVGFSTRLQTAKPRDVLVGCYTAHGNCKAVESTASGGERSMCCIHLTKFVGFACHEAHHTNLVRMALLTSKHTGSPACSSA